jgi:hypothetical protein
MLSHFLRAATPKYNGSITYISNANDANTRTTYTFTLSGTFSPGLYVIGTIAESTNLTVTVSSMTFNSNSMTEAIQSTIGSGTGTVVGIFSYRQTSSITNPVVTVTFSNSCARANIGVWRIDNNSNDTAFTTDSSTGNASSLTNTVNNLNKNYVLVSIFGNSSKVGTTWTNATERYEAFSASSGGGGADYTATSSEASRTITATASASQPITLATAVWR